MKRSCLDKLNVVLIVPTRCTSISIGKYVNIFGKVKILLLKKSVACLKFHAFSAIKSVFLHHESCFHHSLFCILNFFHTLSKYEECEQVGTDTQHLGIDITNSKTQNFHYSCHQEY